MKKIGIFTIISVLAGVPSFADIAANESNPTCDSTTIGVSSGDTTLDAVWNANTLNLKFMANGQQFASNTCTYGGTITIPETEPTRTGYNFAGWRLRVIEQCSSSELTNLYEVLGQTPQRGSYRNLDGSAFGSNGTNMSIGEWEVYFDGSVVKGASLCSTIAGNNNNRQYTNPTRFENMSDETGQEGARYCYCNITDYTNGDEMCKITSSWMFYGLFNAAEYCRSFCTKNCKDTLGAGSAFSYGLYNSIQ